MISQYLAGCLLIVGSFFTLTAAIGLIRLPDVYTRMHAASKAGTLGSCIILAAFAIVASDFAVSVRAVAGIAFFLLTAPIAAHLVARSSLISGYEMSSLTVRDERSDENKTGLSAGRNY